METVLLEPLLVTAAAAPNVGVRVAERDADAPRLCVDDLDTDFVPATLALTDGVDDSEPSSIITGCLEDERVGVTDTGDLVGVNVAGVRVIDGVMDGVFVRELPNDGESDTDRVDVSDLVSERVDVGDLDIERVEVGVLDQLRDGDSAAKRRAGCCRECMSCSDSNGMP